MSALALDLPRAPASVPFARGELRRLEGELSSARHGDLRLVVTELVTNAIEHGRGAIRLDVETRLGSVRGEVAGPDEASVPGLPIVAALTSAWGICPDAAVVWFQIGPVSV
jgi:hypothetical protein